MKEIFGEIWELFPQYDALVITTNASVKKNGEAVMGRGIAREASDRFPTLARSIIGSKVGWWMPKTAIWDDPTVPKVIFTMPTKNDWREKSSIELIKTSAIALVKLTNNYSLFKRTDPKVLMPRPGCGYGGLDWEDVKPVLEPILDDRFYVCTFPSVKDKLPSYINTQ